MALKLNLVRDNDIDITNGYARINRILTSYPPTASGMVTMVRYDFYMTKKAREEFPDKPVTDGFITVQNWKPADRAEAYDKLANKKGVPNNQL